MARINLIRAVVAGSAALTLAPAALAGGEPKNEWPFTRPVTTERSPQEAATQRGADVMPQGEPKNELPFTRPVQQGATIVVRDENGFAWFDAALGAAAGLGVGLVAIGTVTLRAPSRREPRPAL